jgi:lysyl endopeptidase
MKKTILALAILSSLGGISSYAQVNKGGLPLSMILNENVLRDQKVETILYQAPELKTVLKNDLAAQTINPRPDRCGIAVSTNVSFPESGKFVFVNGSMVWRAQIEVTNAPAIGLYYSAFKLPAGVKYFIANGNKKQVLGAYTQENNSSDGLFATEMMEGNVANLEIDIPAGTNINDIQLHIDRVAYFYKGIDFLSQYSDKSADGTAQKPTDDPWINGSSPCHINAICPAGASIPLSRKAVARIVVDAGGGFFGFCSATLINNTSEDCTPYMLTATHCDEDNSTENSHFSTWTFYFNFESPLCGGGGNIKETNTMSGADFVARADYDSASPTIIGDFMLLKLRSKVPDSYGAYLAGWNRSSILAAADSFIGFHHPNGDIKKLSVGKNISSTGEFNQNPVTTPNTHWSLNFFTGGVEGGSSGSALFDKNGLIVGDLTGSPSVNACPTDTRPDGKFSKNGILYSKISRNWEYPEGNGITTKQLKPWLDPINTNSTTLQAKLFTAACPAAPTTGISNTPGTELENAVSIYPNPVSSGIVHMQVNLVKQADLVVTIYDITGAAKATYNLNNASKGEFTFDLSGYANGTYVMKVNSADASTLKKFVVMH